MHTGLMEPESSADEAAAETSPVMGAALDDLNTPDQAMAYLKVSRDTLNRLCRLGRLGYVVVGKERRYTREHLVDFVRRQTRIAHAATGPAAGNVTRIGRPRTTRTF